MEELTKHYGEPTRLGRWLGRQGRPVRAVEEVSFDVRRGEVFALVGESGCGKTTLGRCIVGLLPPTAGRARLFSPRQGPGVELATEQEFRRAVQVVFQHPDSSLNPTKKIGKILERPLVLAAMHREERRQRVTTLLDAVKLDRAYLDRYPHELSGGEKQRLAIARAFAVDSSRHRQPPDPAQGRHRLHVSLHHP